MAVHFRQDQQRRRTYTLTARGRAEAAADRMSGLVDSAIATALIDRPDTP